MPTEIHTRTKDNSGLFRKGRVAWNKGLKCPQLSGKNNGRWGKSGTEGSFKSEKLHLGWKGSSAKHSAIHTWVRRYKGKANKCANLKCSEKSKMFEWANVDHNYRRVLEDYISMCRSCHKIYDIENKIINLFIISL